MVLEHRGQYLMHVLHTGQYVLHAHQSVRLNGLCSLQGCNCNAVCTPTMHFAQAQHRTALAVTYLRKRTDSHAAGS